MLKIGLNNDQLLLAFKREVCRLELEKNLSRYTYMQLRDKRNAPAPTTLLQRLDVTWQELVDMCGFSAKKIAKADAWSDYGDEDLISLAVEAIDDSGIKTGIEYQNKINTLKYPSLIVLKGTVGWKRVVIAYAFKHKGVVDLTLPWKAMSREQIIQLVIFEDQRKAFKDYRELKKRALTNKGLPIPKCASREFGGYKKLYMEMLLQERNM